MCRGMALQGLAGTHDIMPFLPSIRQRAQHGHQHPPTCSAWPPDARARALSGEAMATWNPASTARVATVPITSSASTPGTRSSARPSTCRAHLDGKALANGLDCKQLGAHAQRLQHARALTDI